MASDEQISREHVWRLYDVLHAASLLGKMNDGPRNDYYHQNIDFVWHMLWERVLAVEVVDAFEEAEQK